MIKKQLPKKLYKWFLALQKKKKQKQKKRKKKKKKALEYVKQKLMNILANTGKFPFILGDFEHICGEMGFLDF